MNQKNNSNIEIKCIVDNIEIIESQIKTFGEMKPLFFQKRKIREYNNRIEKLESIKEFLYRNLEYYINNIK